MRQGWVVWSPNPDEPLIDHTPAAGKHYYLSDVPEKTIAVTDGSLNTPERYRYDAYDSVTFWAGSGSQRPKRIARTEYLFTGEEYVAALGFYNDKNRVRSPEIGRFLQRSQAARWRRPQPLTALPQQSVQPERPARHGEKKWREPLQLDHGITIPHRDGRGNTTGLCDRIAYSLATIAAP